MNEKEEISVKAVLDQLIDTVSHDLSLIVHEESTERGCVRAEDAMLSVCNKSTVSKKAKSEKKKKAGCCSCDSKEKKIK